MTCLAMGVVGGSTPRKLLVAHRGASAYAPEHTMAAYRLALDQGADFVEQDLGVTRDGFLICLHDPTLERTTDVEQVFPDRSATWRPRGAGSWRTSRSTRSSGLDAGAWFGLRTTPASGWRPFKKRSIWCAARPGCFPNSSRRMCIATPARTWSRWWWPRSERTASTARAPIRGPRSSCSRSTRRPCRRWRATCRRSIARSCSTPRGAARWTSDAGLSEVATFATGLGPAKLLIESDATLVGRAHAAGLTVIPYTFRSSSAGRFPSVRDEMAHFLARRRRRWAVHRQPGFVPPLSLRHRSTGGLIR